MGCVVLDFIWRKNQADLKFSTVLYRATVGDIHMAKIYDGKTCKAGETSRRVRQPSFKNGTNELYDSVMSESKKHAEDLLRYREFIPFEPSQAYPEYVMQVKRISDGNEETDTLLKA